MSMFKRLFGAPTRVEAPHSHPHSQMAAGVSVQAPMSEGETRRELLRVVLRDIMHRQGIPADWIGAEMLTTTARNGHRGVHWRLLVKHWDPRILTHGVAIQQALLRRVKTFDPLASAWLNGISWQFALADESECPALPHAGSWTQAHETQPAPVAVAQPVADIIIGGQVTLPAAQEAPPVAEADPTRADLEALLAIRDADFRTHADGEAPPTWSRTEPAKL